MGREVLKRYAVTAPDNHVVPPLLILDGYWCHMMASVVQAIQEIMDVDVTQIQVAAPLSASLLMSDSTSHSKQTSVRNGNDVIWRVG